MCWTRRSGSASWLNHDAESIGQKAACSQAGGDETKKRRCATSIQLGCCRAEMTVTPTLHTTALTIVRTETRLLAVTLQAPSRRLRRASMTHRAVCNADLTHARRWAPWRAPRDAHWASRASSHRAGAGAASPHLEPVPSARRTAMRSQHFVPQLVAGRNECGRNPEGVGLQVRRNVGEARG